MKEDFFVPTIIKIFGVSFIFIFVFMFFQNCVPPNSLQRSLIWQIPYEKQKWLDAESMSFLSDKSDNPRPAMARELVNENILIGKTREEIFEMLGKGDSGSNGDPNSKYISYLLEEIYRLDIDPVAVESLVIKFDRADKVEKAEINFYNSSY